MEFNLQTEGNDVACVGSLEICENRSNFSQSQQKGEQWMAVRVGKE